MSEWPKFTDERLLARLALSEDGFVAFLMKTASMVPAREFNEDVYSRALAYPWERPLHSYSLDGEAVEPIDALPSSDAERFPLLAFGSNGAPETLIRKLGGLPPDEQDLAVVTGRLHDFDVGPAALPTFYGAMAATVFASPGTAVRAAIVWATAAQLAAIVMTEVSYFFGRLDGVEFQPDEKGFELADSVFAFASRLGVHCVDGEPVALAAVPAEGRRAAEYTQEELLDRVAGLVLAPDARARDLIQRLTEDFANFAPSAAPTLRPLTQPFESERWTPFPS
jgi:hypothetical protein